MLINVIPASTTTQAAVVFSVTFPDLAADTPIPVAWSAQLQTLRHDDLELPDAMHALDKSAGIMSLLSDVTFDLSAMAISCEFVDGSSEQWALQAQGCVDALEKILEDVNESSQEKEQEQARARERERERERRFAELSPSTSPAGKVTRHKKQRSLLMTLVACVNSVRRSASVPYGKNDDRTIIPLYSPSSSSRLPSPPPTPITATFPSSPFPSPRARRRKARSELVDTFRLYALSELSHRFPRGGYYAWILESMLRRKTEAMDSILMDNSDLSSPEPHPLTHYYPEDSEFFSITASSLPPTPSVSDDEIDTDTDSSSLHTPTESQFSISIRPPHAPSLPPSPSPCPSPGFHLHHRNKSVATATWNRFLRQGEQAEYTKRMMQINRLQRLLNKENARQVQSNDELKHHYDVLEIRSRRRAYLNKALLGGVRTIEFELALALPTVSSSLAQHSWTHEEYEYRPDTPERNLPEDYDVEGGFYAPLALKRAWGSPVSTLFPLAEEDEEEEGSICDGGAAEDSMILDDARDLELSLDGIEIDLEAGLRAERHMSSELLEVGDRMGGTGEDGAVVVGEDEKTGIHVALEVERPQHRPRVRTSSTYMQRIRTPVAEPPLSLRPRPRSLPPSFSIQLRLPSTVCEAEEPQEDCADSVPARDDTLSDDKLDARVSERIQIFGRGEAGVGEVEDCGIGSGQYANDEFTLAMDLPSKRSGARFRMEMRAAEWG